MIDQPIFWPEVHHGTPPFEGERIGRGLEEILRRPKTGPRIVITV
jgi:hypothetical protein